MGGERAGGATLRNLRRDLVFGRLLTLLCGPSGPIPHTLPALTGQLHQLRVIPTWLRTVLDTRPSMLARAFEKVRPRPPRPPLSGVLAFNRTSP